MACLSGFFPQLPGIKASGKGCVADKQEQGQGKADLSENFKPYTLKNFSQKQTDKQVKDIKFHFNLLAVWL